MNKFLRFLALAAILIFLSITLTMFTQAQNIPGTQNPAVEFDCSTISDVPIAECQALVALFNSTNGPAWTNHANWLETTTIANWYGVTVSGGSVTGLELAENLLSGPITTQLSSLSGLQKLYLDSNQLTGTIPPDLGNLTNLQHLKLNSNQLSGPVPTTLGNLANLIMLNLSNNQLSGTIPLELLGLVNLQELNLSGNQLSGTIPEGISNLTQLTILEIGFN